MVPQPRPHELEQLCNALNEAFNGRIVGLGDNEIARQRNFYTKAVAAYFLMEEAGASIEEAVVASIDGGGDHGVDSVYVDATETLWLVQSKYIDSGRGEASLGDVSKFCDGVRDLVGGNYQRFNQYLQAKVPAIQGVMNSDAGLVRAVLVYTGDALSDDRRRLMAGLERVFNNQGRQNFLQFINFGLVSLHEKQIAELAAQNIDTDIELNDYGYVEQPYSCYYGRINALALKALKDKYGDDLFEENIRRFKGSTKVNEGIALTIHEQASHLFYFNNGVTFLCRSMNQIGARDEARGHGRFRVRGLSVINGAQTVGSVAQEEVAHYEANPAELLVTFVSLQGTPDNFANEVTHYRNCQNAVDEQDFAALDENQEQWRRTLELSGIKYQYKTGAIENADTPDFKLLDAARSLACRITYGNWSELLVYAKNNPKKLFDRVSHGQANCSMYSRIFQDSLDARTIWRVIQIAEQVISALKQRARSEQGEDKAITSNSIWLVIHIILLKTKMVNGEALNLTNNEIERLSTAIDTVVQQVIDSTKTEQWGKQYPSVFSNQTDLQRLKAKVMAALPNDL